MDRNTNVIVVLSLPVSGGSSIRKTKTVLGVPESRQEPQHPHQSPVPPALPAGPGLSSSASPCTSPRVIVTIVLGSKPITGV